MCLVSHETHDKDVTLYWKSLFIEGKMKRKCCLAPGRSANKGSKKMQLFKG